MDQWQPYSDPAGGSSSRRYNGSGNQMAPRDYMVNDGQSHAQPPAGFKYDQYQGGLNPQQSSTVSPVTSPQLRDGNGDVAMQDPQNPYSPMDPSMKYPMRPHHQHHLSGGRSAGMHAPQEPSQAAQRYSPMEIMSPTSPYAKPGPSQFSQQPTQRQSPTRPSDYPAQGSYYSSRQGGPQLPPLSAYASGQDSYSPSNMSAMDGSYDPKSPRRSALPPSVMSLTDKGPVPEFKKIRSPGDLKPKVNTQPAFRRANPEGGFISVSLQSHLFLVSTDLVHLTYAPSPSKRSQSTSLQRTESAIQASSTNHREIPAES